MSRSVMLFGVISLLIGFFNTGQVVEAGAPNAAEPQVAVLCEPGASYHPQYSGSGGRWTADLTAKPRNSATCMKDKMEILDYCKKVYPHHDITNIVEASHYVKVGGWCRLGSPNANKCKTTRWVKPFRCLEGPFQSDALLVPESCLFDHIHNQSRCWQFGRWNATAGRACAQRGLRLRTFAMLLPCGISLFSGVEFVCCPKHFKADGMKLHKTLEGGAAASLAGSDDNLLAAAAVAAVDERPDADLDADLDDIDDDDTLNLADDDDLTEDDTDDEDSSSSRDDPAAMDDEDDVDDEDDYDDAAMDEDDAWDDAVSAAAAPSSSTPASTAAPSPTPAAPTTRSTTPPATADPYFTHFDPRAEHQSFKDAQQRLEETHREKVTKVMKDWSELEERYQDMVSADPKAAQSFRQKMTAQFQAEVQSLEEEGLAEKRRMAALHQQRVLSHLATRRRTALTCYTRALADLPPNTRRVQKCLQRLVRALSAERAGALGAWRRAAAAGQEAAAAERPRARDRLADADRALQKAMQQLKRRTNLYNKIGTIMEDYIQAMQSKEDGMAGVSLTSMTPDAEEALLSRVEADARRARNEREHARQQMHQAEEKRTKQRDDVQQERIRTEAVLGVKTVSEEDDDEDLDLEASSGTARTSTTAAPPGSSPDPSPAAASTPHLTPAPTAAPSTTDTSADVSSPSTTYKYGSSANTASDWSTVAAGEVVGAVADAVTVDTGALQAALEQAEAETARARPAPAAPPAHSLRHDIGHSQAGFTSVDLHGGSGTLGGLGKLGNSGTLYPVLCVGAAALVGAAAVALAVARRRTAASPHAQGFVEVEQTAGAVGGAPTPEERHVANMQINGYENPTYKYFEVKE